MTQGEITKRIFTKCEVEPKERKKWFYREPFSTLGLGSQD